MLDVSQSKTENWSGSMIISFSGVDGSGKTTHTLAVKEYLESKDYRVKYLHMIEWTWVNRIGRLLQKGKVVERLDSGNDNISNLMAYTIIILSVVDVFRFHLSNLWNRIFGHRILICDRYFYDLGVQAIYRGMMGSSLESFYWWIIPKPEMGFLLDVSPEKAHSREMNHEKLYYQQKRSLYLERADIFDLKVINDGELVSIRKLIIEDITCFLREKVIE